MVIRGFAAKCYGSRSSLGATEGDAFNTWINIHTVSLECYRTDTMVLSCYVLPPPHVLSQSRTVLRSDDSKAHYSHKLYTPLRLSPEAKDQSFRLPISPIFDF